MRRQKNTIKRLTICSLTTLICATGPSAYAHTGVRDQATSGTASYNGFTITHGCSGAEGGPDPLKVIGQSAVFPFGEDTVWRDLSTKPPTVIKTGAQGIIDGDHLNLNVGGIQDLSLFNEIVDEEVNPDGTDPLGPHNSIPVRALNWQITPGSESERGLHTNLLGITPFKVDAPIISDPCVKKLRVRIAVANWCEREANQANDPDNNRADWWFPGGTGSTNFVDPDLLQKDFWTTLTVNNPHARQCTGNPREVAIEPTGADIDKYLPFAPFTAEPPPF